MQTGGCPFGHDGGAVNTSAESNGSEQRLPDYHSYLQLDKILNAQTPFSEKNGVHAHDELLFIVTHQTYELWFKQILHEIDSVREVFKGKVEESHLGTVVHRLERIVQIQRLLIEQVGVLETMTPMGFMEFRKFLTPSSGFQSLQFRLVENKLGLASSERVLYNSTSYSEHLPFEAQRDAAKASEEDVSVLEAVNSWLERTPFLHFVDDDGTGEDPFDFWQQYKKAVHEMLEEDRIVVNMNPYFKQEDKDAQLAGIDKTEKSFEAIFSEEEYRKNQMGGKHKFSHKAMQAAILIYLYREMPALTAPFRMLELLSVIDENMTTWRYRHAQMVQRMIGSRIGTGGSSGYYYLRATAERHKMFPDLTQISTFLIPRTSLPDLPAALKRALSFVFELKENADESPKKE